MCYYVRGELTAVLIHWEGCCPVLMDSNLYNRPISGHHSYLLHVYVSSTVTEIKTQVCTVVQIAIKTMALLTLPVTFSAVGSETTPAAKSHRHEGLIKQKSWPVQFL